MNRTVVANDHLFTVKEVLKKEANAIIQLIDGIDEAISNVIDQFLTCKGRVIVTGVGKSGIIGRKITATLASTGTPALFLHPTEGLHGDLGMVTKNDIILALSKSGESEEVVRIVPSIKRIGAKLIALVGNEYSTLAKRADSILYIGNVKEACPFGLAPTTSTTLMLTLGDAIAIALLKSRNFTPEDFAIYHPGGSLGKRLLLTVDTITDISNQNPILINTGKVEDAIFNMTDSGLGATSIIDRNGKFIGILTDGDIRKSLANGTDFREMYVIDLYNNNPITIKRDTLVVEALNIMESNKINVLPVINDVDEPISMIHLRDITKLGL